MNNIDFLSDLAGIIKFHRKSTGLSRIELAKLAGVGKTVIYDIEHSKTSVKLNTLFKILDVLNINVELHSPLMTYYETHKENK